jgi:hypothetical protein
MLLAADTQVLFGVPPPLGNVPADVADLRWALLP